MRDLESVSGWFAVGFFDLLGQASQLEQIGNGMGAPPSMEGVQRALTEINELALRVGRLRNDFRTLVEYFYKNEPNHPGIPSDADPLERLAL